MCVCVRGGVEIMGIKMGGGRGWGRNTTIGRVYLDSDGRIVVPAQLLTAIVKSDASAPPKGPKLEGCGRLLLELLAAFVG